MKIFYILIFLVAMALPLIIFFYSHREILRFSLIVYFPELFFNFYIQSIGSGNYTYIVLIYCSYIDRFVKLTFNWFICISLLLHFLLLLFYLEYLVHVSHEYFWENLMINPINYFGLDVFNWVSSDLCKINFALLFPVIPKTFMSYLSSSYLSNYYVKLNRNFSINYPNLYNSDISKNKLNNDLYKIIGGGFTSYKNIVSLGNLIELLDNTPLLLNNIEKYLANLEDKKTYTLLPVFRWIDNDTGLSQSVTISDSMKITKFVNINNLSDKLVYFIHIALSKYDMGNNNIELVLMNRVWLDITDFNVKEDEISIITKTIDDYLAKKKSNVNIDDLIMKRLSNFDNLKYNNILMDNYGVPIFNNGLITAYKLDDNQAIYVKKGDNDTNYITIKNLNIVDSDPSNIIWNWSDKKTDFGFIRNRDGINYFFNNNGYIFKIEASYNFLDYPEDKKINIQDTKIGSIDFETYGNEGIGIQNVYAGGWAINDSIKTNKFYYINKDSNSLDLVKNIITDLANNKDINGYTFYAHNLGRFDSVFLIKACLLMEDIDIKPKWKDNKILSITISNKKNKIKFKLLDSIQMINGSLDSIFKSFEINYKKGIFPHNFVNKDTLFYSGVTPDFVYFKNMPLKIYNTMKSNNWNLKDEALIYLEKDVMGLLDVMIKFNDKIFNLHSLNITNFVTAPKLAVAIYTSKFYNNDLKIKMIRGNVEKEIRSAYFGGNVTVCVNKMNKGFYYDMNSQYPYAMLNDMPIGNPTLSTDKDLNNYFGFVYGEITAPDYNTLRVPYIQLRDEKSDIVDCPRGTFSRMIFSEEIKEALKDGYTFNLKYGYKFERGKNLFKNYVETMYEIKKNTKDPIERALSKLLLNSLYGKFGMKDITSSMKIMSKNEAKKITNNYNYSLFSDLDNGKVLIKYSSIIDDSLRKLLKNFDSNPQSITINSLTKSRGVPSAVQISAAISAYARISINKFKNIPANPCIYSDTDSVVLTKPLNNIFIGKELGQMKLEHQIEEGIFIRKKLYALKTNINTIFIKSSGVKPSSLNYDNFKDLLRGNSVKCEALSFQVKWKDLDINIVNRSIILQGLNTKLIDINDHYDINFKSIITYIPPPYNTSHQKINNIDNIKIILDKYIDNIPYINFIKIKILRLYHYIYKLIKDFLHLFVNN